MGIRKALIRDFERGKEIVAKDPSITGVHFVNDGLPPIIVRKKTGITPIMSNETKGALVPNNVGTPIPTNVKVISQSPVKQDEVGNPIPENATVKKVNLKSLKEKIKALQTDPVLLPKTKPLKEAENVLTGQTPGISPLKLNENPYVLGAIVIAIIVALYFTFKK